jgi:hypothetical protein
MGRARAVRVVAVAKPTGKRSGGAAGASQSKSTASSSSTADKASAAKPNKQKRASQYTTWQAMAQHASNPSATPSGFDESMM